jgi:dihydroorotase
MKPLLLKGGRIVDPATPLDSLRDLRVRDGKIAEIGVHLNAEGDEEIVDASGTVVAPGFIDMHVHLREPGFEEKETIASGTLAAVNGGFTAVACMPNTNPALDAPGVLSALMQTVRRDARCHVHPIAALTRGRQGRQPCDYAQLAAAGAVAFSDDGDSVEDEHVLRDAARRALPLIAPIVDHCLPEEALVARDLRLCAETGKAWHIAHVSTAAALESIAAARSRGVAVTCEVTPHHLTFTDALVEKAGAGAKVNPPLRAQSDVDALRRGVRDGTIDAFASDHAPHTQQEKSGDFEGAAPGFSGLEVAVGAYAAALPDLPLPQFVALLATNPARILKIRGGTLTLGEPADITIFADRPWTVAPAAFASKGKCTPFAGFRLPRRVLATIVGGDVRYRARNWEA